MPEKLPIVLWNLQWAERRTSRGELLAEKLRQLGAELICLTETEEGLLPASGHALSSEPDFGYPLVAGRRKVWLWSGQPWSEVDTLGSAELPPGRFVAGTTETSLGPVRVMGVSVSWKDAHVRTGRRDREPWQEHQIFWQQLGPLLAAALAGELPVILLGEFKQRIPRIGQPRPAYAALKAALPTQMKVATSGPIRGSEKRSIDHLAFSPQLRRTSLELLEPRTSEGAFLSERFGVRVELEPSPRTDGLRPSSEPDLEVDL